MYNNLILISILIYGISFAQPRSSVDNEIGWYGYFGDHKIAKKWSIHTEYQWRRDDFILTWQQSLARFGVNYNIHENAMVTVGYAQAQTFPYGKYPISVPNKAGEDQAFPEHRIYQDLLIKNNTGIFEVNHRLKLEERWLGNLYDADGNLRKDEWRFMMRFRYRFRVAMPLQGKTIDDKEFYLHSFDEILIGAGYNVGANVFDQNRFNFGLGFRVHKNFRIEAGFLSQIVQKARTLNTYDKTASTIPIFEYNTGFLVGVTYNLDFTKKVAVNMDIPAVLPENSVK
ncbi:MAG: DUF2490 domain-containing protein [Bacteroidota bacterium]|nr:DUF2490 domain-containing protein [Bacteroidota bacterium]